MNKFQKMKKILLGLDDLPIYIAGHIKPDQDSICSSLALAKWLQIQGKVVYVLLEKKDEQIIDWQGKSTIIVDDVKDENYNFIALDLNEMKRLGTFFNVFKNAKFKINIDHHQGNLFEADETLSVSGMSSTCEIIYEIIKPAKGECLEKSVCEQIYCGMMNDTNCFSRRLSKNTLKIAQKMINEEIDYSYIIKKTFSERSLYNFKALAKIVNELKFDGIYYAVIDKSLPEFNKLSHNEIVKQIAEDLRKIDNIDIFLMIIVDGNTITCKVMSNHSENADKIAMVFGGGGHKKEAGFTISNSSVEKIIEQTKEYLKL